ncbi:MAG TPA: hypothetical protein VGH51_07140 [Candidatus Angelobacter sp.]|jgi:hypothetical protein
MLILGMTGSAVAQDNGEKQPSARRQLQHIHTPQSIDQELARLTKDLELTLEQQNQVRPLLQEHHDGIQALLDKNSGASRQELAPQIHAISDDTHRGIHALLTDHQKELEKKMQQRERVAVLEFSVPEQERNQLAQAIKSKRHNTKIIMLYFARPGHTEFADVLIEANVRPESLLRAVNYILTNAEKPGDDQHRCF